MERSRRLTRQFEKEQLDILRASSSVSGHGANDVITALNDDVLLQILAFVPKLSDLSALAQTSKRLLNLWKNPIHSDALLKDLYVAYFGSTHISGSIFHQDDTKGHWKTLWTHLYKVRLGLTLSSQEQSISNTNDVKPSECSSPQESLRRKTLGVLTPQEELEALFYDNPTSAPSPDTHYSCGYFGMLELHLPSKSLDPINKPIVVWGDFHGVRIFRSLEDIVLLPSSHAVASTLDAASSSSSSSNNSTRDASDKMNGPPSFVTVAGNIDGGPVLAALSSHPSLQTYHLEEPPCLFLGFASGMIMSISVKTKYTYEQTSTVTPHTDEVTALAFVPKSSSQDMMLASAGADGKVFLYPHSFHPRHKYALENPILAFQNSVSIFSLAATSVSLDCYDSSRVVLSIGDQQGKIGLWERRRRLNVWKEPPSAPTTSQSLGDDQLAWNDNFYFEHVQTCVASTQRIRSGLILTKMEFHHDTVLITGSNFGDVCFWDLNTSRDSTFSEDVSRLTIRHRINSAHTGTVEAVEVCGNIVLTSGGKDGVIKGWDLSKGTMLGIVSCHPGRTVPEVQDQTMLMSSAVGALFHNESIVSICRDGTLHTWDYNALCFNSKSVVKPTEWNCHQCTLLNDPKEAKCRICSAVRKTIPSGFKLKDSSLPDVEMEPYRKKVTDDQIDLSTKRLFLNQHQTQVHWNKMFECLKKYKAETGRTTLTIHEAPQLHTWVRNQRRLYRYQCGTCEDPSSSPARKEELNNRILKLNSIGFVWEVYEKQWNDMFLQLVAYKKVNGHTNVPIRENELGEWVSTQRKVHRKKGSFNPLEKKRVDALNKIGFVWKPYDMKWNTVFLQLLEYKKLNGHTNVPKKESTLWRWIRLQRTRSNDMSQEQIDALNKVGFQWIIQKRPHQSLPNMPGQPPRKKANKRSFPVPAKSMTPAVEQLESTLLNEHKKPHTKLTSSQVCSQVHWNNMFKCLEKYKTETGHTIVTPAAPQLHSWVTYQRKNYQKWISCGTYEDPNISSAWKETLRGCIVKLNSIGFVWEVNEKQWYDMFLQLVAYKKMNGHTNVPTGIRGSKLGEWVSTQRKMHRKKGTFNCLEKKRVDALNKIGFVWKPYDMKWNDMLLLLLEYKKLNGHTNIPRRESALGGWVNNQRKLFNNMSQERIDALNQVGFQWNLQKRTSKR